MTRVGFLSSDPLCRAILTRPHCGGATFPTRNTNANSKVPAVVLLHGSARNADERAATYGPPLSAMGIVVQWAGVVPLTRDGQVVAGAGVSGGTTEQDIAIVEAALRSRVDTSAHAWSTFRRRHLARHEVRSFTARTHV